MDIKIDDALSHHHRISNVTMHISVASIPLPIWNPTNMNEHILLLQALPKDTFGTQCREATTNTSNDSFSAAKTVWNLITPSLSFNKHVTWGSTPQEETNLLTFSSKKGKPKNHQQNYPPSLSEGHLLPHSDTGCLGYSTERSALKH